MGNMSCYNECYEKNAPFIQKAAKFPNNHIANEKKLFDILTRYDNNNTLDQDCSSALSIIQFVKNNLASLYVSCHDKRPFSFCQEYYLFKVTTSSRCTRFQRNDCIFK